MLVHEFVADSEPSLVPDIVGDNPINDDKTVVLSPMSKCPRFERHGPGGA
jgi:hypothetical protein